MAYVKNIWVDQDVERPKTYEVTNNQDGSITLTDSFGLVTELGTPVNEVNMNHIEDGIDGCAIRKHNLTETFNLGEWVLGGTGNDEGIYKSLVASNVGNAITDTTKWENLDIIGINKADKDLSNLDVTSSPNFDGHWVGSTKVLVTGGSFSADTNVDYDLSTYLPNDNYKYEVLGSLYGSTLATSGKYVNMYVKSSECSSLTVASARTRTSSSVRFGGLFIIPIGTNRTITFKDTGDGGIELEIVIQAYRRIGTNA